MQNVNALFAYLVGDDITIQGGTYGGFDACDTSNQEDGIQIWQRSGVANNRVLLDGVTVHDISDHNNTCSGTAGSGRHVDCIQILAGHYITVQNSTFYNCATSDIIARPYNDSLDHITVQNNFLDPSPTPARASASAPEARRIRALRSRCSTTRSSTAAPAAAARRIR